MMLWEIQNNVHRLNGRKNKKHLPKELQKTWQGTYSSTARNVIRMWWLTMFTAQMFYLLSTTDKTLSTVCNESYKLAFAPNHAYVI